MNFGVRTGLLHRVRLLLVTALTLAACQDNPPIRYPTTPLTQLDVSNLALGPGDKVELTIFYGTRDSHATYTLDGAGLMEVQFIGSVTAGGKNVREIQKEIKDRLADGYLVDPQVSVNVVEINSLTCSVFGEVMHNGTIKYVPGMTIVEAIAQSGGFSPLARKNLVRVTRTTDKGAKQTYDIPVEMIAEGKRPNFPMMPGDEVFVPERTY
jgi:polysaccharide export outer membrane protein